MADLKRRLFGYSSASVQSALTERDAVLDRTSKNASAAEQRAERLSSELSETQGRRAGLEEQLDTAEKLRETLTADLERAVAQRGSMEAELIPLRRELEEVHTELRDAKEAILGQDEQLRAARAGSASLEELLRQQAEHLQQATAEAAESREQLRALEESGGSEAAMSAQQARVVELEELVEGYRELIEGGSAEAPSVEPSDAQETPAGPSTASELAAANRGHGRGGREHHGVHPGPRPRGAPSRRRRERTDQAGRRNDDGVARSSRADHRLAAGRHARDPEPGGGIGRRVIQALRPASTAVTALNSQLASLDRPRSSTLGRLDGGSGSVGARPRGAPRGAPLRPRVLRPVAHPEVA